MVELKSFEIFFELVKGKSVSTMLERSQGFSNWIRFTQRSLVALLVGMEDCYSRSGRKGIGVIGWSSTIMV